MTTTSDRSVGRGGFSPRLVGRATSMLSWVVIAGVLAQAVLAGQGWFAGQQGLFGLHGGIGHGVLLVAVLVAVGSWLSSVGRLIPVVASTNVVLLVAQTGLGYTGRRGGVALASSLHVPLGVAILGVAVAVAVLLAVSTREPAA
jgi:hypothetical protein